MYLGKLKSWVHLIINLFRLLNTKFLTLRLAQLFPRHPASCVPGPSQTVSCRRADSDPVLVVRQHVVCQSLVRPGVMQRCGHVHSTVQQDKHWPVEAVPTTGGTVTGEQRVAAVSEILAQFLVELLGYSLGSIALGAPGVLIQQSRLEATGLTLMFDFTL